LEQLIDMRSYFTKNDGAVKMRLDWNDQGLMDAINDLDFNGPAVLRDFILGHAQESVEKCKELLKRKGGPEYGKVIPRGGGWKKTLSIWKRVGDSLDADFEPGSTFIRIGSRPFPEGVKGQRGGNIAQILAGGMKPFKYSPFLPDRVRSSIKWNLKTGRPTDLTMMMKKKKTHPGFKGFNFVKWMENDIRESFDKEIDDAIEDLAFLAGFLNRMEARG
jgi:hypothetical protein